MTLAHLKRFRTSSFSNNSRLISFIRKVAGKTSTQSRHCKLSPKRLFRIPISKLDEHLQESLVQSLETSISIGSKTLKWTAQKEAIVAKWAETAILKKVSPSRLTKSKVIKRVAVRKLRVLFNLRIRFSHPKHRETTDLPNTAMALWEHLTTLVAIIEDQLTWWSTSRSSWIRFKILKGRRSLHKPKNNKNWKRVVRRVSIRVV